MACSSLWWPNAQGEGGQMHLSEAAAPAAKPSSDAAGGGGGEGGEVVVEAEGQRYVLPSQLKQAFVEVEAKQRLVTLAGENVLLLLCRLVLWFGRC